MVCKPLGLAGPKKPAVKRIKMGDCAYFGEGKVQFCCNINLKGDIYIATCYV